MSKCDEQLKTLKEDQGMICAECSGQGGTEEVICHCCNGRGEHYKIPVPKPMPISENTLEKQRQRLAEMEKK